MGISVPFARALAAGRRQFNARVEESRRRVPGFDAGAFSAFLQDGVDGVIVAVEEAAPARTMAVALAAYDIGLDLCLHGLVGPSARAPLLNDVWRRLLPCLAPRIAEQPQDVLGALSNAAVHLSGIEGVRGNDWLGRMAELGPATSSVGELLDLGKVLAWQAGVAHFRVGALTAVDELSPALQLASLGAPADASWQTLRMALADDPWASPRARRLDGWQVGEFTGFGGRFTQPPELRLGQDGFLVHSGSRHFLAMADACGAVLLPATAEEYAAAELPQPFDFPRRRDDRLVFADREVVLDLPTQDLAMAVDAHTLAIASPWTHAIRLMPLR